MASYLVGGFLWLHNEDMTRTFLTLAACLTFALLATIGFGLWSFALAVSPFQNDIFYWHFSLGLATVLGILLVHCLIFTYFLGTGRWVKEVGIAYQLADDGLPKITRELKRATFPPALYSMLIAILTAAAGAGVQLKVEYWPWYVHSSLAAATVLINLWAFRVEYRNLSANAVVLQAVLDEVDRIREAQGLLSNADALIEEEMTS